MARRKLSEVSHPDPLLTDDFWLTFGSDPQPPMRLKILYVTFGEIAVSGPASFNVASVCDRLGITYPMVNHYFGSRDGLIAEAATEVYERYAEKLWESARSAGLSPEDRLRAWISSEVTETTNLGGWSPVLHFASASREVTAEIQRSFASRLNRIYEIKVARLTQLVMELKQGIINSSSEPLKSQVRQDFSENPGIQRLVALVSWVSYGMSVSRSGQNLPASKGSVFSMVDQNLLDSGIDEVVKLVKRSEP